MCHCAPHETCHGDVLIDAFLRHARGSAQRATSVLLGVAHDPAEYVQKALLLEHPFEAHAVTDSMARCLRIRRQCSAAAIKHERSVTLDKWKTIAAAFEGHEAQLHETMDPLLRPVLAGKRILLFRKMLEDSGFPGAEALCDAMTMGFPLGGLFPVTGFPLLFEEGREVS